MTETRRSLRTELTALEVAILEVGDLVEGMVGRSMQALLRRDDALARQVIAEDDEVDERYLDIERRSIDLLATQAPVATDLRLVSVILHINHNLERVGDQAVNLAKICLSVRHLSPDETIVSHLAEMGDLVRVLIRTAMDGFARRDLDLALRLMAMDDPVDELNRGMCRQVVKLAGDDARLEWGIRMNVAARQLERVGDNAVDIGEQVAFLLTGEFREFTDASHPSGSTA